MNELTIRVLGSGTSTGVPSIGCSCETCQSTDPRDCRRRPSVLVTAADTTVLIDTSPDFRQQMLDSGCNRLDGVLYTHAHFDHIGGFDDLRQLQFLSGEPTSIYGTQSTIEGLQAVFHYAFSQPRQWGGGIPRSLVHLIDNTAFFQIGCLGIQAVPVEHGCLHITGYRIGSFAYVTDVSRLPESSIPLLRDLDVLILSALRHEPHETHLHLKSAIALARKIGARSTWFTHLAHQIKHERDADLLPTNMYFCHDGLHLTARINS